MVDPHKKARDADRDAAIEVVESAYADGQITRPDYELRVERLLHAATVGEVQQMVSDLRRAPEEPVTDVVEAVTNETLPPAPRPGGPSTPSSRRMLWVVVAGFALMVGLGLAVVSPFWLVSRDDDSAVAETIDQAPAHGRGGGGSLLTPAGYERFAAALEKKTGSRQAFSVVVYPGYAVVDVPVDASSQRKHGWYFDGDWRDFGGPGTATEQRFDIDQVDGAVLRAGVRRAKAAIEDPTQWYAIVRAPDPDGVCVAAYASNEYGETGYVRLRCDGTRVRQ